ncbi:hypothetical protein QCE64_22670 [Caballeronia sp. LZ043]|nr:hypothetical protein [Caballeronia sp. LZ033]MDR5823272.1 hypothetical protein [Caballeronia sp. LZ043]
MIRQILFIQALHGNARPAPAATYLRRGGSQSLQGLPVSNERKAINALHLLIDIRRPMQTFKFRLSFARRVVTMHSNAYLLLHI